MDHFVEPSVMIWRIRIMRISNSWGGEILWSESGGNGCGMSTWIGSSWSCWQNGIGWADSWTNSRIGSWPR